MKKRNEIIIIILIILIICLIIGLVLFKVVDSHKEPVSANPEEKPGIYYPSEEEMNTFKYRVKTLLDSTNYVNEVFTSTDYDENNSFQNESTGLTCKKYTGENVYMIFNVLDTINESPFNEDSYFQKRGEEGKEDLYVCLPTACKVSKLDISNFEIIDDAKDEEKKIKLLGKEYTLKLHGDAWKFDTPIVHCDANETAE